jgi:aminoglycoside/choline kinase family phosphotransferase
VVTTLDRQVAEYLRRHGLTARVEGVVPLTGDASDRRYVRVVLDGAPSSIVLAIHAGPIDYDSAPFVRVAALFAQVPLPIPALLHHDNALGIIGLQDLGDVTLQAHLGGASATERALRYRQAVGMIARLQQRGADLRSDAYPPYAVAFDVEKLTWELEFFVRHFLLAYRGAEPDEPIRRALQEEWRRIAEALAAEPRVLCHRDYHSRNLMWHDDALYVIDFQDARMGPDTYDLASLLRDSYVDLPEAAVDDLIDYFVALTHGGAVTAGDTAFRARFDLMALQRNLKALGTFGYQTTTRKNPVYMQYVPRTLAYVRRTLGSDARFGRLAELLGGLVDELDPASGVVH